MRPFIAPTDPKVWENVIRGAGYYEGRYHVLGGRKPYHLGSGAIGQFFSGLWRHVLKPRLVSLGKATVQKLLTKGIKGGGKTRRDIFSHKYGAKKGKKAAKT